MGCDAVPIHIPVCGYQTSTILSVVRRSCNLGFATILLSTYTTTLHTMTQRYKTEQFLDCNGRVYEHKVSSVHIHHILIYSTAWMCIFILYCVTLWCTMLQWWKAHHHGGKCNNNKLYKISIISKIVGFLVVLKIHFYTMVCHSKFRTAHYYSSLKCIYYGNYSFSHNTIVSNLNSEAKHYY